MIRPPQNTEIGLVLYRLVRTAEDLRAAYEAYFRNPDDHEIAARYVHCVQVHKMARLEWEETEKRVCRAVRENERGLPFEVSP